MNDDTGGNRGSRRARHLSVMAAAAVTATGLMAGLVVPAISATASPRAAVQASKTAVAAPQVPVLHWTPCDNGFQCATARVPLDYRHPGGTQISIAVIRHVATHPAERIGSLFVNGGGPGAQIHGFLNAYHGLPAVLRERFDLITFAPRGFGPSTAIRCFPTVAAEQKFLSALPPFPVGANQEATWEQTYAKFDALCAERNGSLLDHDTTADVARDMNLIREAVSDPVLNYLGLSYGTGLGAAYANLFPASVGRMILDGNVNPVTWTTSDGALTTFLRLDSDEASASNMTAFLRLCGQATTAACAFSAGSPAATMAKWNTLLRRVSQHPVTIGGQIFTYAVTIASVPLDAVPAWQQGAAMLQQLWEASAGSTSTAPPGNASTAPPGSSTGTAAPSPTGASTYTGQEQTLAVVCSDSPNPRNLSGYTADTKLTLARSGGFGLEFVWSTEACAQWPGDGAEDRYTGPWNRPTASTILLLAITGDAGLPYDQDALAMEHDLARARLLTVQGYGHTEFANPSTCTLNYELSYLQTGALPAVGTVCSENAAPFPAP